MTADLVGRGEELAVVEAFVVSLASGSRALVIEGEAGIGKTRLWQEGCASAERAGARVLTARPAGAEVRLSYSGLGDLLEPVLDEVLPGLSAPKRNAVEAALLLSEEAAPHEPRAVLAALVDSLRSLAEESPVLLAVDDLQWLDAPTGEALAFAARRLNREPVSLLATLRAESGSPVTFELDRAVGDDRLQRLFLGPLSVGALHELLRSRPGPRVTRPLLVRLHEASGGNPFFALQLAEEVLRLGVEVAPGEPLPAPKRLSQLVHERLARLPPSARGILLPVAALSQPTLALLQALEGVRAIDAVEHGVAAGVIEVEGHRVRFSHPLLASVVYSEASPLQRRDVHARLAAIVSDLEERARHLALGAEGPAEDIALALEGAAISARARGATGSAADLAEAAAAHTPAREGEAASRRLLLAAKYLDEVGLLPRAEQILEPLVAELDPGPLRARALAQLALAREARPAFDEEEVAQAGADTELKVLMHRALHTSALLAGDLARSERNALMGAELAEEVGGPALAHALGTLGWTDAFTGRRSDLARLEQAAGEPLHPEVSVYYSPQMALAMQLMYADRLDEARLLLERLRATAAERGAEADHAWIGLQLAELELRGGRWARAAELAEEGLGFASQSEFEGHSLGAFAYAQAQVDAHLGRLEPARAGARRALAASDDGGDRWFGFRSRAVLGFLALSVGDAVEAARELRPLADELERIGVGQPNSFRVLPNALEALAEAGELDETGRLLDALEGQARALDGPWAAASALRGRGLLALARGEELSALEILEGAVEASERLGQPFELGRALLAHGTARRRAREKRAARETLEQARAVFDELGASLWGERATVELGRIGGRAAPRQGELTATEHSIAELVALGRTNQEVATTLQLSVRTVQWNLSKIYSKLGVRSRTELSALRRSR
jgi:DNA-binding CsgD family transcriptional regulator